MPNLRDEVLAAIKSRCPQILFEWLPGGRVEGHQYKCGSILGDEGDSLTVGLKEPFLWKDWAQPDQKGGDLISLYAAIYTGGNYGQALHKLAEDFQIQVQKPKPVKWVPLVPVPDGAYRFTETGEPQPPDIPLLAGISHYWAYTDRNGNLLNFRVRWEATGDQPKRVRPLSYCVSDKGNLEWRLKDLPDPRPLYGLVDLSLAPSKVVVTEGPKSADAGRRLLPGWCVITWSGSATDVLHCDWSPVRNLPPDTKIYLWPDADKAGAAAMARVLKAIDRTAYLVQPDPTWPKGYDLADLETGGWDTSKVEDWLTNHSHPVSPIPPEEREQVILSDASLRRQMEDVFAAINASDEDIYYRGLDMVLLVRDSNGQMVIRRIETPAEFRSWAIQHLDVRKFKGDSLRDCIIPDVLAHACIFNAGKYLRPLNRFAEHPILGPDGKMVEESGYNESAKCYLTVPSDYDPSISVEEGSGIIDDLLGDFPFETEGDKTNAVSFPLAAIMRDRIKGPTPLYNFNAPWAGTGKTLLCRVLCEVIHPFAGMTPLSDEAEEIRKLITTQLLSGAPVIAFDNVERLRSPHLKMAVSDYVWKDRVLGKSLDRTIPIRCLWAVTMNNPENDYEMWRRTVRVRLNAHQEDPSLRDPNSFRYKEIISHVRNNRGLILSAFCALARSASSYQGNGAPRMGGYESFCSVIHPALKVAGYEDFLASHEEERKLAVDISDEGLSEFLELWAREFGGAYVTSKDLAPLASQVSSLPVKRYEGKVTPKSMGRFLASKRDVEKDGVVIKYAPSSSHNSQSKFYLRGPGIESRKVDGDLFEGDSG